MPRPLSIAAILLLTSPATTVWCSGFDKLGFRGEYFRVAEGEQSSGPVVHVILTPDYKISYSLEECDKPIEPAGNFWRSLNVQNRTDHTHFEATVGDFEHSATDSLQVIVRPEASYKVLHLRLFHKLGPIIQDLYPDSGAAGSGHAIGTALNTGGKPNLVSGGTTPMGRPCPTCKTRNAGAAPDFFQAPTGMDALPDCQPSGGTAISNPGPRTGAVRGTSKRDTYTLPTGSRTFYYSPSSSANSVPAEPAAPAAPPPPPRVQVLSSDQPKAAAPPTGSLPPVLRMGSDVNPQNQQ
ncbi:MAG: hypothetical protein HY074_02535 [Deltaproteobacteria bacterium]|nr:hypothetical protein [Deltaproteobacteria bacterium]